MKLKVPKGCGSVSWRGQEYPVVKGVVEVPGEARELLEPGWGFTLSVEDSAEMSAPPKTENRKPAFK